MKYLLLLTILVSQFIPVQRGGEDNIHFFIHGRLRDAELTKSVPFKIKVISLNTALYSQKISLDIIDKDHFKLGYPDSDKMQYQNGNFGTELKNSKMDIQISKTPNLNDTTMRMLGELSYYFIVYYKL